MGIIPEYLASKKSLCFFLPFLLCFRFHFIHSPPSLHSRVEGLFNIQKERTFLPLIFSPCTTKRRPRGRREPPGWGSFEKDAAICFPQEHRLPLGLFCLDHFLFVGARGRRTEQSPLGRSKHGARQGMHSWRREGEWMDDTKGHRQGKRGRTGEGCFFFPLELGSLDGMKMPMG
jgi:hypothetical protein